MATTTLKILDRGRGPEIAGTRITIYDVMDYRKLGWHRDRIPALFRLGSADIQAAMDYIDAHLDEVETKSRRSTPKSWSARQTLNTPGC